MTSLDHPEAIRHFQSLCDACQELTSRYHSQSELRLYADGYIHALRRSGQLEIRDRPGWKILSIVGFWIPPALLAQMAIWELFIAKKKRVGNSFLEFQQPLQTSRPGQAPFSHSRNWLAAFCFRLLWWPRLGRWPPTWAWFSKFWRIISFKPITPSLSRADGDALGGNAAE